MSNVLSRTVVSLKGGRKITISVQGGGLVHIEGALDIISDVRYTESRHGLIFDPQQNEGDGTIQVRIQPQLDGKLRVIARCDDQYPSNIAPELRIGVEHLDPTAPNFVVGMYEGNDPRLDPQIHFRRRFKKKQRAA